jgi:hypothetical protein
MAFVLRAHPRRKNFLQREINQVSETGELYRDSSMRFFIHNIFHQSSQYGLLIQAPKLVSNKGLDSRDIFEFGCHPFFNIWKTVLTEEQDSNIIILFHPKNWLFFRQFTIFSKPFFIILHSKTSKNKKKMQSSTFWGQRGTMLACSTVWTIETATSAFCSLNSFLYTGQCTYVPRTNILASVALKATSLRRFKFELV